jgi:hypothetical protein
MHVGHDLCALAMQQATTAQPQRLKHFFCITSAKLYKEQYCIMLFSIAANQGPQFFNIQHWRNSFSQLPVHVS